MFFLSFLSASTALLSGMEVANSAAEGRQHTLALVGLLVSSFGLWFSVAAQLH